MSNIRDEQTAETVQGYEVDDIIIHIEVLQDFDAAVARVNYDDPHGEVFMSATGSSKRNKGEIFDVYAGRNLAIARALKTLGTGMENELNG